MPPKKKQKVSKPSSSASPSKPSSSRSTRSRTRSSSIASTAPPSKKSSKKSKSSKLVNAEPEEDALRDEEERLSPVWDGQQQPQLECWVEIPSMSRSTEDGLGFIRPRDKKALREEGKHKENADSLVWHT
ncbi:hypothetical protein [Sporisorium scitamineum]|uniref:Uncharacterized protein n=1 Tax=Sporisorium scitamineum TaxID=49012 RepID=A0A0F7S7C1_9BASI|nr:hypothetical protein [Sporisorium scitamineum]